MNNLKDRETKEVVNGIRKYLQDVKFRFQIISAGVVDCSDNQYNYYEQLNSEIKDYFNRHKLYYRYLNKDITIEMLSVLLGINQRGVNRYLSKQRQLLVEFITKTEEQLLQKYPFNDKLSFRRVKQDEKIQN